MIEDQILMLPTDLTKIDDDKKPFWNRISTSIHSILWQPYQLESLGSKNFQEIESSFWKQKIKMIFEDKVAKQTLSSNTIPNSHLPSVSIPSLEEPEDLNVITSHKIRIYPEKEALWFDSLNLFRRAYNLSIYFFRNGLKPHFDFRSQLCDWCICECEENEVKYNSNLVLAAYRKASETRAAVIKKRIQKQKAKMSYMSRNNAKQYFIAPKLSPKKSVFPRILGKCHWVETPSNEAIGKTVVVSYVNQQWFACTKYTQEIKPKKTDKLSIVALDPGVRTFQTTFSENETIAYGDGFVKEKLVPLMLLLDKCLSKRDKLNQEDSTKQWVRERMWNIHKLISRIRARQSNLISDLHKRVALDLVSNYDVILLPTFETKKMSQKNGDRKRFLRKKTVRSMLGLAHYKFKTTLKWMAKKYGKTVIDVCEAYTSKTLWDGSIIKNLGGKTSISYQGKRVNRDQHGARNILIRFLTKVVSRIKFFEKKLYPRKLYHLRQLTP